MFAAGDSGGGVEIEIVSLGRGRGRGWGNPYKSEPPRAGAHSAATASRRADSKSFRDI